jgi:hypothetical protein
LTAAQIISLSTGVKCWSRHPRGCGQDCAVSEKGGDFGPELADGVVIKQPSRSFGRVWAYVIAPAIAKLPQFTLKVHERHGRPLALQRRVLDRGPEVVDELAHRVRGLTTWHRRRTGGREPAEQPQKQERLMRCPLPANLRSSQPGQPLHQLARRH